MQYGHFDQQQREYVIDRVDVPVSWTNYLGVEALCAFLRTGDRQEARKARLYFFVILLFALGAEIGSLAVELLDLPAIWLSCALLFLSVLLLR